MSTLVKNGMIVTAADKYAMNKRTRFLAQKVPGIAEELPEGSAPRFRDVHGEYRRKGGLIGNLGIATARHGASHPFLGAPHSFGIW